MLFFLWYQSFTAIQGHSTDLLKNVIPTIIFYVLPVSIVWVISFFLPVIIIFKYFKNMIYRLSSFVLLIILIDVFVIWLMFKEISLLNLFTRALFNCISICVFWRFVSIKKKAE